MSSGDDDTTPPSLFDEARDTTPASDPPFPRLDIKSDRLLEAMRRQSERGIEELDITGEFARVDTLPDGFAELLKRRQLRVGDVVGNRYRLLEVLGDGAMGQVFVAENQAIGFKVAIKVLKPEILANPEFRQRFQQEAQAVGSIEHANVARFLDLVVGDPTFLVMEYVRGETLRAVLARGRLPIPRAVHIATRLAWGLDAAHAAGIIHRDLKPANVILTSDREEGEIPKLIDFGLAKMAHTVQLSRVGQIIGTPAYMSPEQIAAREVDARSDVYALACLLYEMIAGRPPFAGSDDVQTLYRQLHEPPEPLSLNAPDISARLDRVVNRALAKDPQQRFASMQELARALGGAVEKRPGGTDAIRVVPLPGRARGALVVAALLALVAGVSALVTWRHRARPNVAAAPPPSGTLIVISRPPGASVSVDGNGTAQATPALIDVMPGMHVVALALPGRATVEQHAEVTLGGRALVEATLAPARRSLRVESIPTGALVYVDGHLQIGATPLDVLLTSDEFHQLRLEKDGFELTTRAIAPDDAAAVTVTLLPETAQRGSLQLDSDVVEDVWVDGVASGFVSPTLFRLAAGEHTIQLRENDEPRSPAVKVKIKAGVATHLSLRGGHD
jgi:tRNA A-37 threonylcarbamoyl transferase component Bud32